MALGSARVFVGGVQIVEAWESWTLGTTFFEEGGDEGVGDLPMVARKPYDIVIEFAARALAVLAFSALAMGLGLPAGDAQIAAAVAVAKASDVAVMFVGRDASWDTEGAGLPSIALPGRQVDLIPAVAAIQPRTVVALQTGGPVEMPWLADVAAVLQAWYPGQEAGDASADALLGT